MQVKRRRKTVEHHSGLENESGIFRLAEFIQPGVPSYPSIAILRGEALIFSIPSCTIFAFIKPIFLFMKKLTRIGLTILVL